MKTKPQDSTPVDQRAIERPMQLPDVDRAGCTALRRWREKRGYNQNRMARMLGVSVATYYRYEAGNILNIQRANAIVEATHGAVRYRDLIGGFKPEYA